MASSIGHHHQASELAGVFSCDPAHHKHTKNWRAPNDARLKVVGKSSYHGLPISSQQMTKLRPFYKSGRTYLDCRSVRL